VNLGGSWLERLNSVFAQAQKDGSGILPLPANRLETASTLAAPDRPVLCGRSPSLGKVFDNFQNLLDLLPSGKGEV